ncbi:MAG: DUF1801 domain-containing protein [Ginsengibacter sp.]
MQSKAITVKEYISNLPNEKQEAIKKLRKSILENLPKGFVETISYGMIGYVIPHSIYPKGYHCNPKLPLPFMNIAAQKNFIAVYHIGIYANKKLFDWYVSEYEKYSKAKPDMGKGCIRFKKPEQIPYELIGKLTAKISAEDYIKVYEANMKS